MSKVGLIVKLKVPLLNNPMEAIGIALYDYGSGTQFLFSNGEYDGFSNEEIERFLEVVGIEDSLTDYEFSSVIRVYNQFEEGKFNEIFEKWEHIQK